MKKKGNRKRDRMKEREEKKALMIKNELQFCSFLLSFSKKH